MALKDEIKTIQDKMKTVDEVAQMEKTLIDSYIKLLQKSTYGVIKSKILSHAKDGRKTFDSFVEVINYNTGVFYDKDVRLTVANPSERLKDFIDARSALSRLSNEDRKKLAHVEINHNPEDGLYVLIPHDILYKVDVKKGLFRYKYRVQMRRIKDIIDETNRQAELDGVRLNWYVRLSKGYGFGYEALDIPFNEEKKSSMRIKYPMTYSSVVVQFSYNV